MRTTGISDSGRSRQQLAIWLFAVLLSATGILIAAPQAKATPGIDLWWGNESNAPQSEGGKFGIDPRGVTVNWSSGEVYVVDYGNTTEPNRIERFTSSGSFIAAWGADVDSSVAGTGYEICTQAANCKVAATSKGLGGEFKSPQGIAVDQSSGNVYVTDAGNNRVQVFSASGTFLRAFGQDVVQPGVGTGFEVCAVAENCKAGTAGTSGAFTTGGTGGVLNNPGYPTVAPSGAPNAGNVLIADPGSRRIQEFDSTGAFVRAFGGGVVTSGAEGTGNLTTSGTEAQKKTVTAVATTNKAFLAGQAVAGPGIAPGTVITAVAASTLTLSKEAIAPGTGVTIVALEGTGNQSNNERQEVSLPGTVPSGSFFKLTFTAPNPQTVSGAQTTANIPFNATAAEVQTALGNLANLGAANVEVSLAPGGNPGGGAQPGGPWIVEFKGKLVDTNVATLGQAAGTPVDAGTPVRTVRTEGASGFEVCTVAEECQAGVAFALGTQAGEGAGLFATGAPNRVAEDKFGNVYTVEAAANMSLGTNLRVQKFDLGGGVVSPEGEFAADDLRGTSSRASSTTEPRDNVSEIAVDDAGDVYVVKAFPRGTGTPPAVVLAPSITPWQQRILKVDASEEEVVEVMAANPEVSFPAFESIGGLAVSASASSIYASVNNATSQANPRVFRLQEVGGLTANAEAATAVGASTAVLNATITPAATPLDTAYRFEYSSDGITWTPAPNPERIIGNGSAGGASGTCPLPKAATCHVSEEISGLTPNRTYQVRLLAYSEYRGASVLVNAPSFETTPARPVVTTGAATWSSPGGSSPSLLLGGIVNPGNGATNYRFEYVPDVVYQADKATGDGFQNATAVPVSPSSAGQGLREVPVREVIAGLDPTTTYWYRLVATNPVGTELGAALRVLPPSSSDRFYELVSDGDSWGAGIIGLPDSVADSGDRASFKAQAFGDPQSVPALGTPFAAERGAGGWAVTAMVPDSGRASQALSSVASFSADLGTLAWMEASLGERERFEAQIGFHRLDGSSQPASDHLVPLQRSGRALYRIGGGSADLSRLVFEVAFTSGGGSATLLPEETLPSSESSNLYQVDGAGGSDPSLSIVNRMDGIAGAVIGGSCGARLGGSLSTSLGITTRAISTDGQVVYFSARPGQSSSQACSAASPKRLFKRVGGQSTVAVSQSQCNRVSPVCSAADGDDAYQGASDDGSAVFFTSSRQLANSDTDATADLYVYDADPPAGQPTLAQASAGEAVSGHPTPGSGAKVLGVVDNSADGSRVYFVAEGPLAGINAAGLSPVAGQRNLYVYERIQAHPVGRVAFVGKLVAGAISGDQVEWELGNDGKGSVALPVDGATADGHLLLLVTAAALLPADTDTSKDLYRYDDNTADPAKALSCLSCVGGDPFNVKVLKRQVTNAAPANYRQAARIATADASVVVFATEERLLPGADTNAAQDIYAWQALGSDGCTESTTGAGFTFVSSAGGCLRLISGATEQFGVATAGGDVGAAISPDGADVFFVTQAPLIGRDTNNAFDLYDARVGGGFPEQAPLSPCETQGACQGQSPAPPAAAAPPASETLTGQGNVPQPAPAKCKKGKVRKGGKCVKKPSRHKKGTKSKRGGDRQGSGR